MYSVGDDRVDWVRCGVSARRAARRGLCLWSQPRPTLGPGSCAVIHAPRADLATRFAVRVLRAPGGREHDHPVPREAQAPAPSRRSVTVSTAGKARHYGAGAEGSSAWNGTTLLNIPEAVNRDAVNRWSGISRAVQAPAEAAVTVIPAGTRDGFDGPHAHRCTDCRRRSISDRRRPRPSLVGPVPARPARRL